MFFFFPGGAKQKLGILENKMGTTIVENQMEKNMENDMETGTITINRV